MTTNRNKKKRKVDPLYPDLPRILSTLRAACGLTQAELEEASGVCASSISEYESGKITPNLATLTRLVRGMQLGLSSLERAQEFIQGLRPDGAAAGCKVPGPPSDAERERAVELWRRLRSHEGLVQDALIAETAEFNSWALAETLCIESTRVASQSADQALALARRAERVAARPLLPDPFWSKLRAYVAAHVANAHRVKGDLPSATAAIEDADRHLALGREAPCFLREEERIDALRASFFISARRLDEAREVLLRLLAVTEDPAMRAAHLLNLARAFEEDGDYEASIGVLRDAAPAVEESKDERLRLCLKQNLLWLLTSTARFEEAAAFLPEVTRLSQKLGNDLDWVRLQWARGRVAVGTGREAEGLDLLARVRGEFASRGIAFDTALVTLELALLHAHAGRVSQVKDLARHLAPVFKNQGLHAHALAALALFRQAAEKEAVTVELASRLVAYFEKARFKPELPFEG